MQQTPGRGGGIGVERRGQGPLALDLKSVVQGLEMSLHTDNQRRNFPPTVMVDEEFIHSSFLKVSPKGKLITVTYPCSGAMSRPGTAAHVPTCSSSCCTGRV